MTMSDIVRQMDRLALAGYYAPTKIEPMAQEWLRALEHLDLERLTRGVDNLMAKKTDRWWPTLAELLAEVTALKTPEPVVSRKCPTCDGSTWVEAVPFRGYGLGETVYEGVRRCPDCGMPPPETSHLSRSQRPLSAAEHRIRLSSRRAPETMTLDQFVTKLRAMGQHGLAQGVQGPTR